MEDVGGRERKGKGLGGGFRFGDVEGDREEFLVCWEKGVGWETLREGVCCAKFHLDSLLAFFSALLLRVITKSSVPFPLRTVCGGFGRRGAGG